MIKTNKLSELIIFFLSMKTNTDIYTIYGSLP